MVVAQKKRANFPETFTRQNGYPWKALGTRIPKMPKLTDESGSTAMKWGGTAAVHYRAVHQRRRVAVRGAG